LSSSKMKSTVDDDEIYELTQLGSQFVHKNVFLIYGLHKLK